MATAFFARCEAIMRKETKETRTRRRLEINIVKEQHFAVLSAKRLEIGASFVVVSVVVARMAQCHCQKEEERCRLGIQQRER